MREVLFLLLYKAESIRRKVLYAASRKHTMKCRIVSNESRALLLKVCPYLYTNANEACGSEASPNECQKVVCLAFAQLNLCPALRTYFSLKYRFQTDRVWLFTPNIRRTNKCCSLCVGCTSTSTFLSFGIHLQMWMRLNVLHNRRPYQYIFACVRKFIHYTLPKFCLYL